MTKTENTSTKSGLLIQDSNTRTPEEITKDTQAELDKYGLKPHEEVKITDPLTGETRTITLDRTGTNENKLIMALADPDLTRDRKDHIISMYLWERGKESSSFLVDLFRFKGEHTKETRAFKSQMRFDFEIFVSQFSKYIREQSRLIGITLGVDIFKERESYQNWLKEQRERGRKEDFTYIDFYEKDTPPGIPPPIGSQRTQIALIEMAITSLEEGERLVAQTQNVTKARERDAGKGIYVSREGKIFSHDDPDMDEIIKADRERRNELEKDE